MCHTDEHDKARALESTDLSARDVDCCPVGALNDCSHILDPA
jgi:hypothetical protein